MKLGVSLGVTRYLKTRSKMNRLDFGGIELLLTTHGKLSTYFQTSDAVNGVSCAGCSRPIYTQEAQ